VTRHGALLALTAPLIASAAIAAPSGALAAADTSPAHGAVRASLAIEHPHSRGTTHVRSARERRLAAACRLGDAQRRRLCRETDRRTLAHRTHIVRPSPARKRVAPPSEQSQAVTIAKVLATPCQNAQLTPEPSNLGLVRAAVLCLINTERAQNGEDPLVANAQLEQAAESHGREMISLDYFDHVSPSGLTPVGRIRETDYIPNSEVGYVIGENLAWGTYTLATPQAIVAAWLASPEHLANILESKYHDTGIDVRPEVPAELAEGAPGALYSQEFGVIVG
jgi:uncharacterized protein YkwD